MVLGLVGRKVGMTRIFTEDGESLPVTVLNMANNSVAQMKTEENDGYTAVQIAYGFRRSVLLTKALSGHLGKAGIQSAFGLKEFPLSESVSPLKPGDSLSVESFVVGQKVDITGTTKGRGFSGVIRRHNFSSNRASHGNSVSHNKPGSIGMAQDPGRVFPGKKLPGQYGSATRTVQNLSVVRVDAQRHLVFVKGAVPGADGGLVFLKPAVKVNAAR